MSETTLCKHYSEYCASSGIHYGGGSGYDAVSSTISEVSRKITDSTVNGFAKINRQLGQAVAQGKMTSKQAARAVSELVNKIKTEVLTASDQAGNLAAKQFAKLMMGGIEIPGSRELYGGSEVDPILSHANFMVDSYEFVVGAGVEVSESLKPKIAAFTAYLEMLTNMMKVAKDIDDKSELKRAIREQYEFIRKAHEEFSKIVKLLGSNSDLTRKLEDLAKSGKVKEIKKLLKEKHVNADMIKDYVTLVKTQGTVAVRAEELNDALKKVGMTVEEFKRLGSFEKIEQGLAKYEKKIYDKHGKDRLKYTQALQQIRELAMEQSTTGMEGGNCSACTSDPSVNFYDDEMMTGAGCGSYKCEDYFGGDFLGLQEEVDYEYRAEGIISEYDLLKKAFLEEQTKYIVKMLESARKAAMELTSKGVFNEDRILTFLKRLSALRFVNEAKLIEVFATRGKDYNSYYLRKEIMAELEDLIAASKAIESEIGPNMKAFTESVVEYKKFLERNHEENRESYKKMYGGSVNCSGISSSSVYDRFTGGYVDLKLESIIDVFNKSITLGRMQQGLNLSLEDQKGFSIEQDKINSTVLAKQVNKINASATEMLSRYEDLSTFPIKKNLFGVILKSNIEGQIGLLHAVQAMDKKLRTYQKAIINDPTAARELADLLNKVVIDTNWISDPEFYDLREFCDLFHIESIGDNTIVYNDEVLGTHYDINGEMQKDGGIPAIIKNEGTSVESYAGNDFIKKGMRSPFPYNIQTCLSTHVPVLVTATSDGKFTKDSKKALKDDNKAKGTKLVNHYGGTDVFPAKFGKDGKFQASDDHELVDTMGNWLSAPRTVGDKKSQMITNIMNPCCIPRKIKFLNPDLIARNYYQSLKHLNKGADHLLNLRNLFSIFEHIDDVYKKDSGDNVKIGQIYGAVKNYLVLTAIYPVIYSENGKYMCGAAAMRKFGHDVWAPFEESVGDWYEPTGSLMADLGEYNMSLKEFYEGYDVAVADVDYKGHALPRQSDNMFDNTTKARRWNKPYTERFKHEFKARYARFDLLLVMMIKSMFAKIMSVLAMYNLVTFNGSSKATGDVPDNLPYAELRNIYGGETDAELNKQLYAVSPIVRTECVELYVRLYYYIKFYKKLFIEETSQKVIEQVVAFKRFALLPVNDSKFSEILKLFFLKNFHKKSGSALDITDSDMVIYVNECNKLYDSASGNEKVRFDKIIKEFIQDINHRYGLVKTDNFIDVVDTKRKREYPSVTRLESREEYLNDTKALRARERDSYIKPKLLDGEDEPIGSLGAPSASNESSLPGFSRATTLLMPKKEKYRPEELLAAVYNFRRRLDEMTSKLTDSFESQNYASGAVNAHFTSSLFAQIMMLKANISSRSGNMEKFRILKEFLVGGSEINVFNILPDVMLYRELVLNSANLLYKIYVRIIANINLYGIDNEWTEPLLRGTFLYYLDSANTDLVKTTRYGKSPVLDFSMLRDVMDRFLMQTREFHAQLQSGIDTAFATKMDKTLTELVNIHRSIFKDDGLIAKIQYDDVPNAKIMVAGVEKQVYKHGVKVMPLNDYSEYSHAAYVSPAQQGSNSFMLDQNITRYPDPVVVRDPRTKLMNVLVRDLEFELLSKHFSPKNVYVLFEYLLVTMYKTFYEKNGIWYGPLLDEFVSAISHIKIDFDISVDSISELGGVEEFDQDMPFSKKVAALYKTIYSYSYKKEKLVENDLTQIPEDFRNSMKKLLPIYLFLFKFIIKQSYLHTGMLTDGAYYCTGEYLRPEVSIKPYEIEGGIAKMMTGGVAQNVKTYNSIKANSKEFTDLLNSLELVVSKNCSSSGFDISNCKYDDGTVSSDINSKGITGLKTLGILGATCVDNPLKTETVDKNIKSRLLGILSKISSNTDVKNVPVLLADFDSELNKLNDNIKLGLSTLSADDALTTFLDDFSEYIYNKKRASYNKYVSGFESIKNDSVKKSDAVSGLTSVKSEYNKVFETAKDTYITAVPPYSDDSFISVRGADKSALETLLNFIDVNKLVSGNYAKVVLKFLNIMDYKPELLIPSNDTTLSKLLSSANSRIKTIFSKCGNFNGSKYFVLPNLFEIISKDDQSNKALMDFLSEFQTNYCSDDAYTTYDEEEILKLSASKLEEEYQNNERRLRVLLDLPLIRYGKNLTNNEAEKEAIKEIANKIEEMRKIKKLSSFNDMFNKLESMLLALFRNHRIFEIKVGETRYNNQKMIQDIITQFPNIAVKLNEELVKEIRDNLDSDISKILEEIKELKIIDHINNNIAAPIYNLNIGDDVPELLSSTSFIRDKKDLIRSTFEEFKGVLGINEGILKEPVKLKEKIDEVIKYVEADSSEGFIGINSILSTFTGSVEECKLAKNKYSEKISKIYLNIELLAEKVDKYTVLLQIVLGKYNTINNQVNIDKICKEIADGKFLAKDVNVENGMVATEKAAPGRFSRMLNSTMSLVTPKNVAITTAVAGATLAAIYYYDPSIITNAASSLSGYISSGVSSALGLVQNAAEVITNQLSLPSMTGLSSSEAYIQLLEYHNSGLLENVAASSPIYNLLERAGFSSLDKFIQFAYEAPPLSINPIPMINAYLTDASGALNISNSVSEIIRTAAEISAINPNAVFSAIQQSGVNLATQASNPQEFLISLSSYFLTVGNDAIAEGLPQVINTLLTSSQNMAAFYGSGFHGGALSTIPMSLLHICTRGYFRTIIRNEEAKPAPIPKIVQDLYITYKTLENREFNQILYITSNDLLQPPIPVHNDTLYLNTFAKLNCNVDSPDYLNERYIPISSPLCTFAQGTEGMVTPLFGYPYVTGALRELLVRANGFTFPSSVAIEMINKLKTLRGSKLNKCTEKSVESFVTMLFEKKSKREIETKNIFLQTSSSNVFDEIWEYLNLNGERDIKFNGSAYTIKKGESINEVTDNNHLNEAKLIINKLYLLLWVAIFNPRCGIINLGMIYNNVDKLHSSIMFDSALLSKIVNLISKFVDLNGKGFLTKDLDELFDDSIYNDQHCDIVRRPEQREVINPKFIHDIHIQLRIFIANLFNRQDMIPHILGIPYDPTKSESRPKKKVPKKAQTEVRKTEVQKTDAMYGGAHTSSPDELYKLLLSKFKGMDPIILSKIKDVFDANGQMAASLYRYLKQLLPGVPKSELAALVGYTMLCRQIQSGGSVTGRVTDLESNLKSIYSNIFRYANLIDLLNKANGMVSNIFRGEKSAESKQQYNTVRGYNGQPGTRNVSGFPISITSVSNNFIYKNGSNTPSNNAKSSDLMRLCGSDCEKTKMVERAKNAVKYASIIYKSLHKIYSQIGEAPKYLGLSPYISDMEEIIGKSKNMSPISVAVDAIPSILNTVLGNTEQNILKDLNTNEQRKGLGLHCNNINDLDNLLMGGKRSMLEGLTLFLVDDKMHKISISDFPQFKSMVESSGLNDVIRTNLNIGNITSHIESFGKLTKYLYEIEFKNMFANQFPVFNSLDSPKYYIQTTPQISASNVNEYGHPNVNYTSLLNSLPSLLTMDGLFIDKNKSFYDIFKLTADTMTGSGSVQALGTCNGKAAIEPETMIVMLEINTNTREMVDYMSHGGDIKNYNSLANKGDQTDEMIIRNVVDVGIMPININSMMREIPLANTINGVYSFDVIMNWLSKRTGLASRMPVTAYNRIANKQTYPTDSNNLPSYTIQGSRVVKDPLCLHFIPVTGNNTLIGGCPHVDLHLPKGKIIIAGSSPNSSAVEKDSSMYHRYEYSGSPATGAAKTVAIADIGNKTRMVEYLHQVPPASLIEVNHYKAYCCSNEAAASKEVLLNVKQVNAGLGIVLKDTKLAQKLVGDKLSELDSATYSTVSLNGSYYGHQAMYDISADDLHHGVDPDLQLPILGANIYSDLLLTIYNKEFRGRYENTKLRSLNDNTIVRGVSTLYNTGPRNN